MKKVVIAIIVVIIIIAGVVILTNSSSEETEEVETVEEEVVVEEEEEEIAVVGEYVFTYEGEIIEIDEIFDQDKIGEPEDTYEVESCAFEGMDIIYEYEHFEIETYEDGEDERIYSIYFTDTKAETSEGVVVSDSFDTMVETYGENYENTGTQYTYTSGSTCLEFIVENEVITSIKYVLDAELN